jgi:UPF0755 protein
MKWAWIPLLAILFAAAVRPRFWKDPEPVQVTVPKGASVRQIAQILGDRGVVDSPFFFRALAKVSGRDRKAKSGEYLLERGRYWKAVRMISEGRTVKTRVTIPEGWSAWQIAEKFRESGILENSEDFAAIVERNGLEGRLFPETYFFDTPTAPEAVLEGMSEQFHANWPPEFEARAQALKMTQGEVLTLASIIEREAQVAEERPVIASVYHNRLKKRMLLEADPTVQYALGKGRVWKDRVLYADLKVDSPYNTYRRRGLPPAPICNPGRKSIEAALHPAETDYLYFVADGTGRHSFFTNLKDHLKKVAERRRALREMRAKSR